MRLNTQYMIKSNSTAIPHLGFLRTMITESPRRNILLMNLSLLTGWAFFFPFPVFGTYMEEYKWSVVDMESDRVVNKIIGKAEARFLLRYSVLAH